MVTMSTDEGSLNLYDDEYFMDSLQSATGWTNNPPLITKSQVPSLSTIMELEDKDVLRETEPINTEVWETNDHEPELVLDIELEEGWEKGPRPTAAELASDFEGGAGDGLDENTPSYQSPGFSLRRSWGLASPWHESRSFGRSPRASIMLVSQSVGPGKLIVKRNEKETLRSEDQLAVTSPEFMMYTPAATTPTKRSVLLQTSANSILAARGRKLFARAREINSEQAEDSERIASDASITMIPRPESFFLPTWRERRVVSCRARNINHSSSRSKVFPWQSFSILDETLCFDDEDDVIKYPRDINFRKARSHPSLTFAGHQSAVTTRNVSSSTCLGHDRNGLADHAKCFRTELTPTHFEDDTKTTDAHSTETSCLGATKLPPHQELSNMSKTDVDELSNNVPDSQSSSNAKTETASRGNISQAELTTSKPLPLETIRQPTAPTKTTRKPRLSHVPGSKRTSAHFNNSSESAASKSPVNDTKDVADQQQVDQTRILITGPFHIPHPPPLPRPPRSMPVVPCSKNPKRCPDHSMRQSSEHKGVESSEEWQIARTSFVTLVDQPSKEIKKQHSIRQASIPLSSNEARRELVVSAIHPIPYQPAARSNNQRVVPPISTVASASIPRLQSGTKRGVLPSNVCNWELPCSGKPDAELDNPPGKSAISRPKEQSEKRNILGQKRDSKSNAGARFIKTSLGLSGPIQQRYSFGGTISCQYGSSLGHTSRGSVLQDNACRHQVVLTPPSFRSVFSERPVATGQSVPFDFQASLRKPTVGPMQLARHVPRRLNIHLVPAVELGACWKANLADPPLETRCVPNSFSSVSNQGPISLKPRAQVSKQVQSHVKPLGKSFQVQRNTDTTCTKDAARLYRKTAGKLSFHSAVWETQGVSRRQQSKKTSLTSLREHRRN
ncbi:uncharacterized protein LOC110973161 [Acanthaster planci]|uniref:Uncharacterized protein LOC110973161 n=1 Tax=Acanthaster planci TaxID=133434 RepID=A0A8B7XH45_ACAPL|nr:uncharacterized protein LOC110973161 [Acanthaster planci]XP_022079436.1 uncharacterized protein LOC110973161 [Acanthaster planci]XP_022079437.1 uncharacterized protein LOC110973161 [Acanthaster planci]